MKKTVLLVAVMLLASTVSYANCGNCPGDKAKGMGMGSEESVEAKVAKLTEKLSLTEEQAGQVKALVEDKVAKKKEAKEECAARMESIKEEFSSKLKGILTEEQQVKYEQCKWEGKKGMKGMDHGPKHDMMKEELKKEIKEELKQEMKE